MSIFFLLIISSSVSARDPIHVVGIKTTSANEIYCNFTTPNDNFNCFLNDNNYMITGNIYLDDENTQTQEYDIKLNISGLAEFSEAPELQGISEVSIDGFNSLIISGDVNFYLNNQLIIDVNLIVNSNGSLRLFNEVSPRRIYLGNSYITMDEARTDPISFANQLSVNGNFSNSGVVKLITENVTTSVEQIPGEQPFIIEKYYFSSVEDEDDILDVSYEKLDWLTCVAGSCTTLASGEKYVSVDSSIKEVIFNDVNNSGELDFDVKGVIEVLESPISISSQPTILTLHGKLPKSIDADVVYINTCDEDLSALPGSSYNIASWLYYIAPTNNLPSMGITVAPGEINYSQIMDCGTVYVQPDGVLDYLYINESKNSYPVFFGVIRDATGQSITPDLDENKVVDLDDQNTTPMTLKTYTDSNLFIIYNSDSILSNFLNIYNFQTTLDYNSNSIGLTYPFRLYK